MQVFIVVVVIAAITVGEVLSIKYTGPTALPVVLHNGYLADTHEVAAAKNAHIATLSHQSHGGSSGHQEEGHYTQNGALRYHGYSTLPEVQHDGHIADTHEVAAAKAEHFAAVAKARAHGGYHHGDDYNSNSGYIADTHEVAAAKAEHFAAVAKARSLGGHYHGGQYDYHSEASGAHHGYGTHASYNGPLAKPVVLPSGYLADTVEVANAKQQHFHLVHSSQSKHVY